MAQEASAQGAAAAKAKDKDKELDKPVHVWPDLVSVEFIGLMIFTVLLSLTAMFVRAPLFSLANPELTPNPSKAPWYFLGLQELLMHMHPALAGVIVPTAVLVLLAAIPFIDSRKKGTGIWFYSAKGIPITIFSAIYTTVWNVALILIDEYLPAAEGTGIMARVRLWLTGVEDGLGPTGQQLFEIFNVPEAVAEILVPILFMTFIPVSLAVIVKRRWQADTRETTMALFTFFVASFVVLTLVGTAFRGQGMELMWPWQIEPPIGH